jgi:AcrR family transcriptional regulator
MALQNDVGVLSVQESEQILRASLINAAADVFGERGYTRAELKDIARRAGATVMDIEGRFRSKEELAAAVIAAQHRIVTEDVLAVLQQGHPPLDAMIIMCREFGRRLAGDPMVRAGIRLTFEASAFGHGVREPYSDWIKVLESLAAKAAAAGQLRPGTDPDALARLVVACFTGVQLVSAVMTDRDDVLERISQMWEILLSGIINEAAGTGIGRLLQLAAAGPHVAMESAK